MLLPVETRTIVPIMGETKYILQSHPTRILPQQNSQDSTSCPYSAVSSFNQPSFCDSTLITPISTRSSMMAGGNQDQEIKLSPSTLSPTFHFLPSADDFTHGRYDKTPPMKHKSPSSGTFAISSWDRLDNSFPESPQIPSEHYYGAYGVSAISMTPVSSSAGSSPVMHQSPPNPYSTGGHSSSRSSLHRQSTPVLSTPALGACTRTPKLLAPTPSALRPATNMGAEAYRASSMQSLSAIPLMTQSTQVTSLGSSNPLPPPPKGKKRKSVSREQARVMTLDETKMSRDDRLLIDLALRPETLPWKQIEARFEQQADKPATEAALQMRLGRAIKRYRVWTEEDEQAMNLAVRDIQQTMWQDISERMVQYGCRAPWSAQDCEARWRESNGDDGLLSQYEMPLQSHTSDDDSYSPERATCTMEESSSGAVSSLSPQFQMRHQGMYFDQQQTQNDWDAGA